MASHTTSAAGDVAGYKHGRVPRAIRNQQLLDLAEQLLIENGFAGFSIEDLCRAAGVSRPIVYERFGSKEGIYLACLRRVRGEFEQALIDAAASTSEVLTALERGSDAFFSTLEREPRRWSLVYGGATALVGPIADDVEALRTETVDRIAAILASFIPHADPERLTALAHAISGAGEQLGRWWLRNPDIPRHRIVAHHCDFCAPAIARLADSVRQPLARTLQ